jgi:hypothetical protein
MDKPKYNFGSVGSGFDSWLVHYFMDEENLELVRLLLARLERISADSYWAHRASGIRGTLLGILDDIENDRVVPSFKIKQIMEMGFFVLERAAKEKIM